MRSRREQLVDDVLDRRVEVVGELVHEADAQRDLGAEALARHEVASRGPGADLRERERRDDRRHDAELHLAERELRARLRDDDVAAGDEAAAAAERVPLHARDDRCRAAVDRLEHRAQPERVGDVLLVGEVDRGAHPVDVRAGRERRAVAREHDGARVADVGERPGELGDQRRVEGVSPLRPRQRDPQHRAVALDPQRARAHQNGPCGS